MDYRERGSYARGVYTTQTQDTSRISPARGKQEKEADIRVIAREW